MLPTFPPDFQKRILRYRRWQDAQSSLIGRVLLNTAIKKIDKNYCYQELLYTDYNKPFFESGYIKFNISHSGTLVICAATETTDIGIDIELLNEIDIWSFRQQMTETEWKNIVFSDNIKNSFYNYWTQKEAVIKAHGQGLSLPLKSFEIIQNRAIVNNEEFFLKEIKVNSDYKCHLSVQCKHEELATNIKMEEYIFPTKL